MEDLTSYRRPKVIFYLYLENKVLMCHHIQCLCICIYIYIYIYVCVCVCVYIYIYISRLIEQVNIIDENRN